MRFPLFKTIIITGLLSIFLLGLNASDSIAEEESRIIFLKGRVKVQHPGDVFWILAKKGMALQDKDKIKTFVGSEAEIALDSTLKNIIKLEPKTEVTIEDLKNRRLHMPKGKVLSLLEALPAGSSFEVRTPTAVVGVAGTGIWVDTDGKKTTVRCHEDKAYVKGIKVDGTYMPDVLIIDKGYKRIISRFKAPGDLVVLTTFEREHWSQFREKLREHLDTLRDKRAEGSRDAALEMFEIHKMRRRFQGPDEGDEF